MACFNAKAHYKKAKELYFIGQVVKLPIQVKEAERDESYTKFKVGEWVLKVKWLYPVAGRPLHYSDVPPTRQPSHDTIHLESLTTALDKSSSHHTPLPVQLQNKAGVWVLSSATHAALTDPGPALEVGQVNSRNRPILPYKQPERAPGVTRRRKHHRVVPPA